MAHKLCVAHSCCNVRYSSASL